MVERAQLVSPEDLAQDLVAAPDFAAAWPASLPCAPLDLLLALHQLVLQHCLSDIPLAGRGAAVARQVAERFPDQAILAAQAHWTEANAILYVPDYAGALAHFDAALAAYARACAQHAPAAPPRDVRVVQVVRVFCLSELGRYAEALDAVAQAEAWLGANASPRVELTLLLNRSQLAGTMDDYQAMAQIAAQTVALARKLGEPARRAQGWINSGHARIFLGDFGGAARALRRGVAQARRIAEPLTLARGQWNQARLLRCQGRLFDALTILREAERGLLQAPGEAATVALEEAAIYQQLRQLPDALRASSFAAEEFARRSMPYYSATAFVEAARVAAQHQRSLTARDLLARAVVQAGQAESALLAAQIDLAAAELAALPAPGESAAARTRRQRGARTRARRARRLLEQAGLLPEALRGALAVAALDAALGDSEAARAAYGLLVTQPAAELRLAAHAGLGALLDPAAALPHLERAAELVVEQRRTLPMEELQARYSSETSQHHARLAAGYLALGAGDRCLATVCAAKAGPLLDLRATARNSDPQDLAPLQAHKADLARWRQQVRSHRHAAALAVERNQREAVEHHRARAAEAEAQAEASGRELVAAARSLGDRGGHAAIPTPQAISAALPADAALLEYAQLGDDLAACLLLPGQPPRWRLLGPYRALAPLLDRWSLAYHRQRAWSAPSPEATAAALAPLRALLFAPWAAELHGSAQLIIAPCGILYSVPWAALADQPPFADLALSITPCGAMWAARPPPPSCAPGPPLLLGHAGEREDRLDHVGDELATIGALVPDAQIRPQATTTDLRQLAAPPRLLHIAAHGLTNPAAPLCSTIELADGPLLLVEAHRLDLRGTELVVLSACETGVRPDYGEMALALVGAFLCAGARAVVATLWQVDDQAAAALMAAFYKNLAAGSPPVLALRQAQAALRERYPLDWPAFQLWVGTHS